MKFYIIHTLWIVWVLKWLLRSSKTNSPGMIWLSTDNFPFMPNGHIFVDSRSIKRRNSIWKVHWVSLILKCEPTWKLWHRFNVEISTWNRLSKSTKYRSVFHVDFSTLFPCQIDVTALLTVSSLSISNIFCHLNLF